MSIAKKKNAQVITTHGLVVGVDGTLDELKDKSVMVGNVGIHKCDPLVH
jgi:hypothetical protein